MDFMAMIKAGGMIVKKHAPAILTGVGISGFIGSTVLAVSRTPEALKKIDALKKELGKDKLDAAETIKAAGKCYIPSAITAAISSATLIAACAISGRRTAAIAAACTLSETALREYRDKVRQALGRDREHEIVDGMHIDRMEQNPPSKEVEDNITTEGRGSTLCYDGLCGRYFYSDIESLRHAANELNRRMTSGSEMYVSLNEFYSEIGLPPVEVGDVLGWNVATGLIELYFTSHLAKGRVPCLFVSFELMPAYGFSEY